MAILVGPFGPDCIISVTDELRTRHSVLQLVDGVILVMRKPVLGTSD